MALRLERANPRGTMEDLCKILNNALSDIERLSAKIDIDVRDEVAKHLRKAESRAGNFNRRAGNANG